MRKLKRLTLGALLAFLLVSCQSYKKVPYLQDTAFVNDTEQSIRQTGVKFYSGTGCTFQSGKFGYRSWSRRKDSGTRNCIICFTAIFSR